MILHLIHDDKVLPRMISQFEEVCPGNNVYLCVMRGCDKNNLKYLRDNPYVIRSDSYKVDNIAWERIDKICIHYLSISKLKCLWKLVLKFNLYKSKIIWVMWGGDIYDILERKGFVLYSKENSFLKIRKSNNKGIYRSFIYGCALTIHNSIVDFTICHFINKRLDYLVSFKEEYDLFNRYIHFSRCKELLNYNYYPIEDTLGTLVDKKVNGDSIIIGNSASESNNHEYVLNIIKDLNFGNSKIYVPLSYGEDKEYISIIEEKFNKLPNTFILKEFLPLEEYHKLLMSCSTFIYGNFRQEAWGNILVALYLGGKVYISEKSILSESLRAAGYKIFITENIKETYNVELTEEEKKNNRSLAMETCSREKNKKNIEYINSI